MLSSLKISVGKCCLYILNIWYHQRASVLIHGASMGNKEILCLRCKHYYSSWDPKAPRGCKLYGFISVHIPKDVVKRETGSECQGYSIKITKKKELDLNDDSLW